MAHRTSVSSPHVLAYPRCLLFLSPCLLYAYPCLCASIRISDLALSCAVQPSFPSRQPCLPYLCPRNCIRLEADAPSLSASAPHTTERATLRPPLFRGHTHDTPRRSKPADLPATFSPNAPQTRTGLSPDLHRPAKQGRTTRIRTDEARSRNEQRLLCALINDMSYQQIAVRTFL